MRKFLVFGVLLAVLALPGLVYAIDSGYYLGIGANYALPIGMEYASGAGDLDTDFDNATGVNLKVGYQVNEFFSVEFNFDKYAAFEWEDNIPGYIEETFFYVYEEAEMDYKGEADLTSFMLAGKFSANASEQLKPFLVAGTGFMMIDHEVRKEWTFNHPVFASYSGSETFKDDGTVLSGKIGGGVDFYVKEDVSLGFEASYIFAQDLELKELNDDLEIGIFNLNLGAIYHF